MENLINFLTQIGVGSLIGVIIGMAFQYFISKRLKIFETKLIIFRRVYKQLYYILLMNNEERHWLDSGAMPLQDVIGISNLDFQKDIGNILFYVDGDLEKLIASLMYDIQSEMAPFGKSDFEKIEKIIEKLKKFI